MCKKIDDDFSEFFTDPVLHAALVERGKHVFDDETPEQIAADDEFVEEMETLRKAKKSAQVGHIN